MNLKVFAVLFLAVAIGFTACKKSSDAPAAGALPAALNVINATTDTINFYLNGTRLNSNGNLYPASSSGYINVASGAQNYQVKNVFNPVNSVVKPLFSINLKLDTSSFSSLFVAGNTADLAFKTDDILVTNATVNTSLVRFVNASPDAGSLDMHIGDTVKFDGLNFKSASGFALTGVSGLKPVIVYKSGSSTPVINTTVAIVSGLTYTFYVQGSEKATGAGALSVGVSRNN